MKSMELLTEPNIIMRSIVTRVEWYVSQMVAECIEHGLPIREFAMHIEIGTKLGPKEGVPAFYVSSEPKVDLRRDDVIRIAPMPFGGFKHMSKDVLEVPLLSALLATEGKIPTDLVISCTDNNAGHGFVGYAVRDFGLSLLVTVGALPFERNDPLS